MSSNLLSGIKVIPRHRIDEDLNEPSVSPDAKNRRSSKEKRRSVKNKGSDDELERISKRKKKKKWYSSDEYSVSSSGSETETSGSEVDAKKKNRKRKKKIKKSTSKSSSSEDDSGSSCKEGRNSVTGKKKKDKRKGNKEERDVDDSKNKIDDKRKELGLDWMLRPNEVGEGKAGSVNVEELEEPQVEEVIKANPRELNPYLKNDGDGYPDEAHEAANSGSSQLFSTSVVGDGGASWRLKALKRAQEQAAREGKRVEEVVGERWGSLSQLSIPAKVRAAPSRAHLHAIKNRQKGVGEGTGTNLSEPKDKEDEQIVRREYLKDVSVRHPEMKAPKLHESLSWGKRRDQNTSKSGIRPEPTATIIDSSHKLEIQQDTKPEIALKSNLLQTSKHESLSLQISKASEISASQKQTMSANQLAAKALQLRMKGKHEEAEELQRQVERMKQNSKEEATRMQEGNTSRYVIQDKSLQRRRDETDDMHLAQTIMQNKRFTISGQADDEYDYDGAPQRKTKNKGGSNDRKVIENTQFAKRIMTQQERCQFCFENPNRPKHLVLSIANYTYLMLPQRQHVGIFRW
uniref:Cwf19-like C-terminal domain-containing protein n=1 Tax=Kalanchoe fedtschenkoi TaxID=63787 RepID=A0A7N0VLQ8_KALFE